MRLVCIAASILLIAQSVSAENPASSSSSRRSRESAIAAIPLQQMNRATQAKLAPILRNPSMYRRMPVQTIRCDHDMHVFLVRKPEVVVNIWQLMGITEVTAKRVAEYELQASDGAGTNSQVELVYGTPNLHVYFGEGVYEGPMFRQKLTGRSVIVLRSDFSTDKNGMPLVTDRMDVFVQLDNVGVKIIARTLQPLVGKAADHNFVETAKFISRISDAAQANPRGVQGMAARLSGCEPVVRESFSQLAAAVAQRAQSQPIQNASLPPVLHRK